VNDPQITSALLGAFGLIVPEIVLLIGACVLFLGATFPVHRNVWGAVALATLAVAGIALGLSHPGPGSDAVLFASPVLLDGAAVYLKAISLAGGAILVLCAWDELPDRQAAEYHGCLLLLVAGLCLTGAANDLITLFLALELVSIPTYILLYLPRADNAAQEAAAKYFLLSVFSSGLLLFGFSYLYGMVGTTNIPALVEALDLTHGGGLPGVSLVALVMVLAGLGFRITAVPFHFYAPDVYQGSAPAVASLLAYVPKVAGFAALLRLLGFLHHGTEGPAMTLGVQVPHLLWILSVVTMSLGNVLALLQDNVKRMLAYSSVAHAGYMLIGLVTARFLAPGNDVGGVDAVLFYLVAYGAMTVGAFTVLGYLSTPQRPVETVEDLAGLGLSRPGVAALMALFLFSLIGIPWTAGFAGKWLLFWGAMGVPEGPGMPTTWFRALALIAALNAAVGAWYYLRIVTVMYLGRPLHPLVPSRRLAGLAALLLCAVVTLVAGVYPRSVLGPIRRSVPETAARPGVEPGASHSPAKAAANTTSAAATQ
jgi:NADH-quinone oxidoreductase subunit N